LRWRSARLAAHDSATIGASGALRPAVVRVPAPTDAGLKTALQEQRAGRDADATDLMLERLTDDKLSTDDRRIALMSLASTFQADDDLPAAAMVANELTAMDPCALSGAELGGGAHIDNDAYTGMRTAGALLDHTRTGARCFAHRPGATFLRGLLIPGYGQYSTWSPLVGRSVAAITVAGAIGTAIYIASSNSLYSRYQSTLNGAGPPYFQSAVDKRALAKSLAISTGLFWVAAAIEAELQERAFASRLATVHEFWFRPIVGGVGGSGSSALGMSGGITFRF
jgi:hypothetical protein